MNTGWNDQDFLDKALGFYQNNDQMLVSLITTAVTQSIHTGVPTSTQLTSLITELCKKWPVVHDELNPTLSVPSIIVDLTWLLDQDESIDGEKRSRLAELIQLLIQNNCIPIYLLKERLEPELLESLNIIPHAKKFAKTIIRMNTTLLYKQTKFNLLREETEGYSKLCVELVENLPQPLDVYWSKDKSSGHQIHIENRKNHIDLKSSLVLRNISSLIGFFDLDPNRVLDVILDIFAANVMDHWEFFIVLLSKSPWQPKESSTGQRVPREIVGQILGFKFSYYTREESTTPVQLFWVAALLVKHGIVRLEDLYPHLHPEDEQIPKDYQTYTMGLSKKARGAGRYITPKLSGMLGESLPTINTVESDSPLKKPEPRAPPPKQSDQKSGLVQALIALGDLNYSMKIIDMHPQLAPMNTDIGLNICRLLNVMLEAVDSPLRPLAKLNRKPTPSVDEFSPAVSTLNLRLCKLHDSYVTTGRKYYPAQFRFFYELWKDEVPVAESFLKALGYLKKYLPYVGHHLYGDVLLLGKIIRIGKHHVTQSQHEETIKNNWMAIIARFIFPAVAQLPANPGLGFELWKLIKLWPYTARYGLYGEWRHFTYKNIPELVVASTGCKQDMSWILKRLSKDNIKLYGRHIGKIVHSNPTIAFSEMLPSLQKYNNLIPLIVDDTRYLTDLELDILSFCLIESFARTGNDHDRIEENGTTFEAWLKALALFCGTLFKKHGIDMQGIFQYIANQLLSNNVYDLLVLQELITHMTGIDVPADAGIGQLAGLSGGTWIRRVVFVYESARNLRKPTARLVKALLSSKLTMQLGILIAKHRKEIVFRHRHDEEDPSRVPDLKVLAWLNDHCQQSFLQYFEFLTDNIGSENYLSLCPSFKALVNDYELDVGLAFHILRPKISYLIQKSSIGNSFVAKKATTDSPAGTPGPSTPKQSDEMEIDHVDGGSLVWSSEYTLPVLQEIITTVKDSNILKKLSVEFYATFWQLALPDIHVPIQRYESELQKLKDTLSTLEKKKDRSKSDASNRRRERDRALSTQQHLTQELNAQKENQRQTLERLKAERHGWFQSTMFSPDSMEEVVEILQFCIYPRCAISAADAIYCAKFVSLLHSIGTPNLSIVTLYDQIWSRDVIHATIFSLTETEARNYGLFLAVTLEELDNWHKDEKLFEKEAIFDGRVGFYKSSDQLMNYEDFRTIMFKWHLKLRKCFLSCLQSGEFMQMRNSIIVLDRINKFYPKMDFIGKEIEAAVNHIEATEKRSDMVQLAKSYCAKLQPLKKAWIPPSKFCNKKDKSSIVEKRGDTAQSDKAGLESSNDIKLHIFSATDDPKPSDLIPSIAESIKQKNATASSPKKTQTATDTQSPLSRQDDKDSRLRKRGSSRGRDERQSSRDRDRNRGDGHSDRREKTQPSSSRRDERDKERSRGLDGDTEKRRTSDRHMEGQTKKDEVVRERKKDEVVRDRKNEKDQDRDANRGRGRDTDRAKEREPDRRTGKESERYDSDRSRSDRDYPTKSTRERHENQKESPRKDPRNSYVKESPLRKEIKPISRNDNTQRQDTKTRSSDQASDKRVSTTEIHRAREVNNRTEKTEKVAISEQVARTVADINIQKQRFKEAVSQASSVVSNINAADGSNQSTKEGVIINTTTITSDTTVKHLPEGNPGNLAPSIAPHGSVIKTRDASDAIDQGNQLPSGSSQHPGTSSNISNPSDSQQSHVITDQEMNRLKNRLKETMRKKAAEKRKGNCQNTDSFKSSPVVVDSQNVKAFMLDRLNVKDLNNQNSQDQQNAKRNAYTRPNQNQNGNDSINQGKERGTNSSEASGKYARPGRGSQRNINDKAQGNSNVKNYTSEVTTQSSSDDKVSYALNSSNQAISKTQEVSSVVEKQPITTNISPQAVTVENERSDRVNEIENNRSLKTDPTSLNKGSVDGSNNATSANPEISRRTSEREGISDERKSQNKEYHMTGQNRDIKNTRQPKHYPADSPSVGGNRKSEDNYFQGHQNQRRQDFSRGGRRHDGPNRRQENWRENAYQGRPDSRQDGRHDIRQDGRHDMRQDGRPDIRQDGRPDSRQDGRPNSRQGGRSDSRQDIRPDSRQDNRSARPEKYDQQHNDVQFAGPPQKRNYDRHNSGGPDNEGKRFKINRHHQ